MFAFSFRSNWHLDLVLGQELACIPFEQPYGNSSAESPQELIFGLFFQVWARRAQMTPVTGKSFRKVSIGLLNGPDLFSELLLTWNYTPETRCMPPFFQ